MSSGQATVPLIRSASSSASSRLALSAESGLLISCATPAASVPSETNRSRINSCISSARLSVTSRIEVKNERSPSHSRSTTRISPIRSPAG